MEAECFEFRRNQIQREEMGGSEWGASEGKIGQTARIRKSSD